MIMIMILVPSHTKKGQPSTVDVVYVTSIGWFNSARLYSLAFKQDCVSPKIMIDNSSSSSSSDSSSSIPDVKPFEQCHPLEPGTIAHVIDIVS